MAGGPLLPSSIYLGGASGNLSPTFYVSGAGTTVSQSYIEGIGVVASLNTVGVDAAAVLQFNLPEVLPTGTLKCRVLAWANASSGIAKLTLSDGGTAPASNIANTTLTGETQLSQTWATADIIVEVSKQTLTGPNVVANNIYTVMATWNHTGWTLAAQSVWQLSLVWE
jgi:hypothetical protein